MYAVIVENDSSEWEDTTGVRYHFPKRYLDILKPGTVVVYYKGSLKNASFRTHRLTDKAHYFGTARIGNVYADRSSEKGDMFAIVEAFSPFEGRVHTSEKT